MPGLLETADPDSTAGRHDRGAIWRTSALRQDEPVPDGLCDMLQSAVASASKVRDRFSVDGWLALNDLAQTATAPGRPCADR
jgi:uncharacterized alpha-E superfamily protein